MMGWRRILLKNNSFDAAILETSSKCQSSKTCAHDGYCLARCHFPVGSDVGVNFYFYVNDDDIDKVGLKSIERC
jgi:hypothetical protein